MLLFVFFLADVGGYRLWRSETLVQNGVHTEGKVVRIDNWGSRGGYIPVVSFQTPNGAVEQLASVGSFSPAEQEGDTVEVLYAKDNPQDWTINNWRSLYFLPTLFFALAGFALIGTIVVAFLPMRTSPSMEQAMEDEKSDLNHW
jgi:hypothetical protein